MTPKQPVAGTISAAVAQEKARRHLGARVNVFIADKFSFAVSADVAFKHGLCPDLTLSEDDLAQILREDGEAKALQTALNFLAVRARSREEIRKRLARDEWSETVISRVLERLENVQLLDDGAFARGHVENRSRFRPRGAGMLKQELRQKGVTKEEIEAALPDAESETQNAVLALQKAARRLEKFEGREQQNKAIELLARRGFSYGIAKTAFKIWSEDEN